MRWLTRPRIVARTALPAPIALMAGYKKVLTGTRVAGGPVACPGTEPWPPAGVLGSRPSRRRELGSACRAPVAAGRNAGDTRRGASHWRAIALRSGVGVALTAAGAAALWRFERLLLQLAIGSSHAGVITSAQLRALIAVVDHGGFSGAARSLRQARAAIS